jgi:predicted ATPase
MRIERLSVRNYRALHAIDLSELTPLTVLLGPNGIGKSTIFDVFRFLSECFTDGLPRAWDRRGRFRELRTRGESRPIVFDLQYREDPADAPATCHLEIVARGPPWASSGSRASSASAIRSYEPAPRRREALMSVERVELSPPVRSRTSADDARHVPEASSRRAENLATALGLGAYSMPGASSAPLASRCD